MPKRKSNPSNLGTAYEALTRAYANLDLAYKNAKSDTAKYTAHAVEQIRKARNSTVAAGKALETILGQ